MFQPFLVSLHQELKIVGSDSRFGAGGRKQKGQNGKTQLRSCEFNATV